MTKNLLLSAIVVTILALLCVGNADASAKGADAEEALALLREYLRIDTTNPPGNEIRAARFFKGIFDSEGIESRIFESAPGRANIYARLKGDGSRKAIVLLNHTDVVPARKQLWAVDPFSAEIKDGCVWGRGAMDMKSMGIVELAAMLALKREKTPLKADVIFLGVADEEAGGALGAGYMLKEHFDLLRDAGTVLNEFGYIYASENGKVLHYDVRTAEKRPFWLKLTATGKPGHGSAPAPESATAHLIEALHRIAAHRTSLKVEPVVQKFYADTAEFETDPDRREHLRDLRQSLKDPVFAEKFTKDKIDNSVVRNTISITMLEGSDKINVIPAVASAQLDIRLLPSEDAQGFLTELRSVIADESIQIEPLLSFVSSSSPAEGEFFEVLSEVARNFHPGVKITTPLLWGFTDCHYFREQGIPCYGFVPFKFSDNDLGGVHGNNEKISLDNVKLGTQFMYELVRKMATR